MREEETLTVFVTKWALTTGIRRVDARREPGESMIYWGEGWNRNFAHGEGKDWHRTVEEATQRAESMRQAKIDALTKQIKRLRDMRFAKEPA